jgi:transglutaminase-like putative cysteine protease
MRLISSAKVHPPKVAHKREHSAESPKRIPVVLTVLFCVAGSAVLLAAGVAGRGRESVMIGKPPPWVVPLVVSELRGSGKSAADSAKNGIEYLVRDEQIRLNEGRLEQYRHRVSMVVSAGGLEQAAEIKIEFEPSYEQLVIHHVQIRRGGATIDALRPREIKLIQQEDSLSDREYNGRISALMFLSDVRIGDAIDYAYSISGQNPVLRGRFACEFTLADYHPTAKRRVRLLSPVGKELYFRTRNTSVQPATNTAAGWLERVWELTDVPALDVDDDLPGWFDPMPTVQVTDFKDWSEVVYWNLPLFNIERPLSSELAGQIERWRSEITDPGDRLLAALRFVQDEVRYLAVETGPYSHQPKQPSNVLKRRYGDCKDKSLLLAAMLTDLGIDANPALVNTEAGRSLDDWLPSPYAFNHCIVRAQLAGKTYWLDPTITLQRGKLGARYNPQYDRALLLAAGSSALESIPAPSDDEPGTLVRELYTVEKDGAANLEVVTTYRGAEADSNRYSLSRHSMEEIGKYYLNYYAETYPGVSSEGPPTVTDDQELNIIVLTKSYRIPAFWKDSGSWVVGDLIRQEIKKPAISQRSMPLGVEHPLHVRQEIEVRLDSRPQARPFSGTISDDAIRLEYKLEQTGNSIKLKFNLRSLQDNVPAKQVSKHLATLDQIRSKLSYWTPNPGAGVGSDPGGPSDGWVVATALLLIGVPIAVFMVAVRIRRGRSTARSREFRRASQARQGEAPAEAISISSEQELGSRIQSMRCDCGKRFSDSESPAQKAALKFDGRRLVLVMLKCNCGKSQDLYFAPSAAE